MRRKKRKKRKNEQNEEDEEEEQNEEEEEKKVKVVYWDEVGIRLGKWIEWGNRRTSQMGPFDLFQPYFGIKKKTNRPTDQPTNRLID